MILWFQIFKIHHTDGVVVQDNNDTYTYPMPMYAQGKMFLWVEFVDESQANTLNMWIVADNLRKGAYIIQIAEYLVAIM
jgi:aspartate-semialdehyde dehydrogenase